MSQDAPPPPLTAKDLLADYRKMLESAPGLAAQVESLKVLTKDELAELLFLLIVSDNERLTDTRLWLYDLTVPSLPNGAHPEPAQ